MRFVITLQDAIWLGLLALAIVMFIAVIVLSWLRSIGEKVFNKTVEKRAGQTEREGER